MSYAIFGDWTVPPSRFNFSSTENNQIHYTAAHALIRDLRTLVRMGEALGGTFEEDAAHKLLPIADRLASEFVAQFFDSVTETFGPSSLPPPWNARDGPRGGQTVTAMALDLGVVPSSAASATVARLVGDVVDHGMHATVGILGNAVLFEQLAIAGRSDVAEAVLTSTNYPSFGCVDHLCLLVQVGPPPPPHPPTPTHTHSHMGEAINACSTAVPPPLGPRVFARV
jgi:hypothetical protein